MSRTFSHIVFSCILVTLANGCKTTVQAPTEAPALGSDAKIVAKKNKTGTYAVSIDVLNLAPPSRLDAGATTFVVWFVPKNAPAVRAGELAYDEGDRRGQLESTSPNAQFNVLITLEKGTAPASPGGKGILDLPISAR